MNWPEELRVTKGIPAGGCARRRWAQKNDPHARRRMKAEIRNPKAERNPKSEIRRPKEGRNPKSEGRKKAEIRNLKSEARKADSPIGISAFGFPSEFGIRISVLLGGGCLRRLALRLAFRLAF